MRQSFAGLAGCSQWPLGLAAAILGVSAAELAYRLAGDAQRYTQFTVGSITWRTAAKTPDYLLLAVLAVTSIGAWFTLRLLSMRIGAGSGRNVDVFASMVAFCSLPAVAWLGATVAGSGAPFHFVHLGALAILTAVLLTVSLGRAARAVDGVAESLPVSLVIVLLGALFLPAVVFALNRLRMLAGESPVWWGNPALVWLSAFGALVATGSALAITRRLSMTHARYVVASLQLPLPWLFLVVLPLPWVEGHTVVGRFPLAMLPIGAWTLIAIGYIDLIWRWPGRGSPGAWNSVLSPISLAAVVLVFRVGIPPTAAVSPDDYHFGEWVLPWWSWASEGLLPFRDYVPARGLTNYADGACAALLGDGTASFISACQPLVLGSWFVLAIASTSAVVGALAAAGMFAFMPLVVRLVEVDLAITSLLMVGWWMFDKAPGVRWVLGWSAAAVAVFLFAPGQGTLFVTATTPLAFWQAGRAVLNEPARLRSTALWSIACAGVLLLVTPLGAMLLGAWRYVTEHSAVASTAHAIEWAPSVNTLPNYWMAEAARSSFILVPVLAAVVLGNAVVARDWRRARQIALFAVPVMILGFLYIPRAAGRIDPANPSRLGPASAWMFATLLPVVLRAAWPARKWPAILAFTSFIVGAVSGMYRSLDLRTFEQRAVPAAGVPMTLIDGLRVGLPALGLADVQADHLKRLMRIRRILDTLLDPSETYLDMTNRNAHYFYFERRPPIESGALYNLPNDAQQLRAIGRLRLNPVPVVLASADSILPDGSVSLRSHALYRYYVQRLSPVSIDGFVFLVEKDRFNRLEKISGSRILTDEPSSFLEQAFPLPDLHGIAASWGRSFDTLQGSARRVLTLPRGSGGVWDLAATPLDGRSAGLLLLSLNCAAAPPPIQMTFSWTGDAGRGSVLFLADRTLVLPLDASPRWLLARRITGIQLKSSDGSRCGVAEIKRAELWQRQIASVTDD